jgi:hypothetical protein
LAKKIAENMDVNPSFLQMSDYSLEEVISYTVVELNLGKDKQAIAKPFGPLN